MSNTNFTLYSIPAAFAIAIAPHFYAIGAIGKASSGIEWDNANPRNQIEKLKGRVPQAQLDKIQRAEAAQQNGFENLGLFAASIVAGNMARLPLSSLNMHAGGYLISRVIFNILYVNVSDQKASTLRTITYFTGIGFIFSLFVQAGMQVNGGNLLSA